MWLLRITENNKIDVYSMSAQVSPTGLGER